MLDSPSGTGPGPSSIENDAHASKASAKNSSKLNKFFHSEVNLYTTYNYKQFACINSDGSDIAAETAGMRSQLNSREVLTCPSA